MFNTSLKRRTKKKSAAAMRPDITGLMIHDMTIATTPCGKLCFSGTPSSYHTTQPAPLMPVEPGSKQQQHGTGLQHGVKKPLPQVSLWTDVSLPTAAMASYCARTGVPGK